MNLPDILEFFLYVASHAKHKIYEFNQNLHLPGLRGIGYVQTHTQTQMANGI